MGNMLDAAFPTIDALRDSILQAGTLPQSYADKMLHHVPELPVVHDRKAYLVEKAKGRVVLDLGCTGEISSAVRASAGKYYGVDQQPGVDWEVVDLDHRPDLIPKHDDVGIIIASEIIEHLANPGYLLMALKEHYPEKELYVTVPHVTAFQMHNDCELVNGDHVAWYSYTTLKTLLRRYRYEIQVARWYQGAPNKPEGLIVVAK